MRKGVGISGLSRHTATTTSYASLSSTITQTQLSNLTTSLNTFRDQLRAFASQHRGDIRKDPAFRHQFQKMCAAIGVDPLAGGGPTPRGLGGGGGGGGWWTEILGLGEFQFELAVQVVDVCISTRERNGGVIEMGELIRRVEKLRGGGGGGSKGITSEDVLKSLELLRPLHAGYTTHSIGGTIFIRSIPRELDTDQSILLVLAQDFGGILTETTVREKTGWGDVRTRTVLDDCVMREGLGWVDEQGPEREVWIMAAVEFADGGLGKS